MTGHAGRIIAGLAILGLLGALVLPLASAPDLGHPPALFAVAGLSALLVAAAGLSTAAALAAGVIALMLTAATAIWLLDEGVAGAAGGGYWCLVIAVALTAAGVLRRLSAIPATSAPARRLRDAAVPLVFGALVCFLWEVVVRGFGIPGVLIPAPSAIAIRFVHALPILAEDFVQTFVRGVLTGYAIGCGAGLLTAILAHRFVFLGRGLLPLGNFVSALPIVGIAPIMVMWFGFDWQSKAAVVAVITFFPMLVNALAGLDATAAIDRDLLRSYGASYSQSLPRLFLPAALPFIFNALKINSTLALIGAIVAEFFGTPTRGMGFRISAEVGRMSLDMVWAEIVLAALAGMSFYAVIALTERATTFWHPSQRPS